MSKKINLALILIIIGVFLSENLAYSSPQEQKNSLRNPLIFNMDDNSREAIALIVEIAFRLREMSDIEIVRYEFKAGLEKLKKEGFDIEISIGSSGQPYIL